MSTRRSGRHLLGIHYSKRADFRCSLNNIFVSCMFQFIIAIKLHRDTDRLFYKINDFLK